MPLCSTVLTDMRQWLSWGSMLDTPLPATLLMVMPTKAVSCLSPHQILAHAASAEPTDQATPLLPCSSAPAVLRRLLQISPEPPVKWAAFSCACHAKHQMRSQRAVLVVFCVAPHLQLMLPCADPAGLLPAACHCRHHLKAPRRHQGKLSPRRCPALQTSGLCPCAVTSATLGLQRMPMLPFALPTCLSCALCRLKTPQSDSRWSRTHCQPC